MDADLLRGRRREPSIYKRTHGVECLDARVGIYDITFSTGPTASKIPLDLEQCAVVATPRVETASTPEEVAADIDVQRLGGARIFVESPARCRSARTRSRRSSRT